TNGLDARNISKLETRLADARKKGGACAEPGHTRAHREGPQATPVGSELGAARRTVEETDGGAAEEPPDLDIPHHPAGCAVPVKALAEIVARIAWAEIEMDAARGRRDQNAAV